MKSSRFVECHTFFDGDRGDKPARLADMTLSRRHWSSSSAFSAPLRATSFLSSAALCEIWIHAERTMSSALWHAEPQRHRVFCMKSSRFVECHTFFDGDRGDKPARLAGAASLAFIWALRRLWQRWSISWHHPVSMRSPQGWSIANLQSGPVRLTFGI